MDFLTKSFVKGVLVLTPLALTAFLAFTVIRLLDGLVPGIEVPGVGLLLTISIIVLVGAIAGNSVGRRFVSAFEEAVSRVPILKLVHGSFKDLLQAFVGEQKRFDRPAMVDVGNGVKLLGFLTCERFDDPQLYEHVAVYLPQAYNFAGNVIIVKRSMVRSIDADGAQFMAFVVSGGVATMNAAATRLESPLFDV